MEFAKMYDTYVSIKHIVASHLKSFTGILMVPLETKRTKEYWQLDMNAWKQKVTVREGEKMCVVQTHVFALHSCPPRTVAFCIQAFI